MNRRELINILAGGAVVATPVNRLRGAEKNLSCQKMSIIGVDRKWSAHRQNDESNPLLTSPDKNILSRPEWLPALAMEDHDV